jgi:hypothetical protein
VGDEAIELSHFCFGVSSIEQNACVLPQNLVLAGDTSNWTNVHDRGSRKGHGEERNGIALNRPKIPDVVLGCRNQQYLPGVSEGCSSLRS